MEMLLLKLGGAIAKSVLSLWLGEGTVLGNTSGTAVDALLEQVPNLSFIERRRIARQFDRMAEAVAEKLSPFLQAEFGGLPENERSAAVLAVADAVEQASITSELLFSKDLNPLRLEDHVRATGVKDRAQLIPAAGVLFDHLLREACNYAVEIAMTLPPFASQAARESLRRESEIIDLIHTVLSKLPDPSPAGRDGADDDARFDTQYRRTVARRLDHLELFGLDVSPLSKRYALSVAYITLSASSPESGEEAAYVRVSEALAGNQRMLVRGDAGSGKTTLLQWLAVTGSRKGFDGALAEWNGSVPFFIQLRRYAGQSLPRPEDFVAAVAPAEAGRMPPGWVHRQLETGRALVLVDGVDELADDDRQRARDWLLDLIATFEDARYVVTSRPSTPEDWLTAADFRHCALQPMTLGDVESFVNHWHDAMRAALPDAADHARLDRLSAGIMAALRARPPIRSLATSPLLCAMLCALNRERSEQLPEDRMELYRVALEMLLERRDVERRVPPGGLRLPLKEKQILLRDLAYWLVLNNYVDAAQRAAVDRITQKLPAMQRISEDAGTVFQYLMERSGVLRAPAEGRVDFIHRTFQEYLAAEEAVEQGNIGMLIANAPLDQWREIVILAAGHASLRQREELLKGLLERGDREPGNRHRLHLLACACLETSPEVPSALTAELQDALSMLVPPRNMAEAQAVASAGQLAVPLLGGFRGERARVAAACVRALALIGGDDALAALEAYGDDYRQAVFSELMQVWSSLQFDPARFARRVLANSALHGGYLEIDNRLLIPGLRHLPNLRRLRIAVMITPHELEELRGLTSLESLDVDLRGGIADLSPLQGSPHLRELTLRDCQAIRDLSPLSGMTALQDLRLWYCTSLTDLSPLAALKNLSLLEITHAMSLADITPLAELNKLDALDLRGCAIADLTPIARLANLEWLVLSYSPSISDSEFRSFLLSVPSVYIYLSSSELANVPTELRNGENVYFMVSGADLPADSGG